MAYRSYQSVFPKATMWLALNKSLFAQLMYAVLNDVTDEVPTAATTGRRRMFNEEYFNTLTFKQQASGMVHEILHDALLHQFRRGNRLPKPWNYACDIKINNMMQACGMDTHPDWLHEFDGKKFEGETEEAIYDYMMQHMDKMPEDYEPDLVGGTPTPDDVAAAKGRLQTAIEMHGQGSLPQELKDAIAKVLNPEELWYEWLRKFFTAKQYSGCDWTATCRREYMRTGMVAPPFMSDTLGVVVISVDQSGSIDERTLAYFAGHVNSILMDCKPERVVVQYFDTEVHDTEEFVVEDMPIELRRVCGGGTSFVDPCKQAEEYGAVVHIMLTDMHGTFPKDSTVATVWASTSGVDKAPFGEVVQIKEK